ncbi:MAG: hypothetical protein HXS50_02210 [Theionarchaea archaeon]|nr:hypothetical protein [Theionarchaea archaeon]
MNLTTCLDSAVATNFSAAIYGTSITAFIFPYHMGRVLGYGPLPHLGHPGLGTTRDMLHHQNGSILVFDNTSYDLIIISWGLRDNLWSIPREETMSNARQIFRKLKETGAAVAFYNQITEYSEDYAEICDEEGVVFVSNISDIFGNGYLKSDPIHPNEEGYGILAERVAQYLLDAGAIEYAVTCEETSGLIEEIFEQVDKLMNEAILAGFPDGCMTAIDESYTMAKFLRDNDHCYTAMWELEEKLIRPLISMLEVEEMRENARVCISQAVEAGTPKITIDQMESRYKNATEYFSTCEFDEAEMDLEWILQVEISQLKLHFFVFTILFLSSREDCRKLNPRISR